MRMPFLALGMGGLLFTAGCQALGGCSNPDAYGGAQEVPLLEIPVGLDGLDTTDALEIPPLTTAEMPRVAEGSCLEEPPPMLEPGTTSAPVREDPADEPGATSKRNPPVSRPR
jgi:hypothetical protein